jgi:5-methylcytosine-specific restriction endonuclease McrA
VKHEPSVLAFDFSRERSTSFVAMPLIDAKLYPAAVVNGFKAALAGNAKWNDGTANAAKAALIDHLLVLQDSRCAYCKRLIKNEIGLLELDHILPQAPRGKVARRKTSNARKDRRVTAGYPAFRFEPSNLILTCKRCNHRKGSYDCRRDRSAAVAAAYPAAALDFEWIHPVHHDFDDHITILKEFVYREVAGSNGPAVIYACDLTGIEALEARAREYRLKSIKDASKLAATLWIEDLPMADIVDTVMHQFPAVSEVEIRRFVRGIQHFKIR